MSKELNQITKYSAKIIDHWLPYKIEYEWTPGMSVGIMINGKPLFSEGYGFADLESKIPSTPKTLYRIASISKSFTSVAIFQLCEKGKISLEDKVEKFVPWFNINGKNANNVTIRQLMSHTAGVYRDGTTDHWITDKFPDIAGLKKSINNKAIVFENLTCFKYSNFGYALLGEIIKKVSGLEYREYVKKHIIQKLGMKNTEPDFTKENLKSLAKGYSRPYQNREREVFPRQVDTKAYAPATGFISNVDDLTKYVSALSLERNGKSPLVSRESKKEMYREHWNIPDEKNSYGLGFEVYEIEKRKIIGHSGGFAGFETKIALDVENDLGIITLTNGNNSANSPINKGIFETVYTLLDNKGKYIEGKKLQNQQQYEGTYRSRWGMVAVAGLDSNLLAFGVGTDSPMKTGVLLKPKGKDKFLLDSGKTFDSPGEMVRFTLGKNDRVAKKMICGSMPFERIIEN